MENKRGRWRWGYTLAFMGTVLLIFASGTIHAGGSYFAAEIVEFSYKGNNEFQLILFQFNAPYTPKYFSPPKELTIHLRYNREKFLNHPHATQEQYRQAINLLLRQCQKGGKFKFGVIGEGYQRMWTIGKFGEYQSNGLDIHDEIVYSRP